MLHYDIWMTYHCTIIGYMMLHYHDDISARYTIMMTWMILVAYMMAHYDEKLGVITIKEP